MELNRHGSTPLYVQLKDLIAAEIKHGTLRPGDRIRSEAELEREHGISRITVRQAISTLVHEGELYRVPGKGTYVASPKVEPLSAFTSFAENMAAQGLKASYRPLVTEWMEPPARVRDDLHLAPGERAFYLERLLLANDTPMCIQRGYYAERFLGPAAGLLTREALASTSLYWLLEQRAGLKLWKAEETVEPSVVNREEVRLLGVPRNTPVLVITRLSYLVTGEPIETVKLVFRGDKYRYRVNLFRRPT